MRGALLLLLVVTGCDANPSEVEPPLFEEASVCTTPPACTSHIGHFTLAAPPIDAQAVPVAVVDLNHDGHLDLVASNANGTFVSYLGDGKGHLRHKATLDSAPC
jgi:hypothetical protein